MESCDEWDTMTDKEKLGMSNGSTQFYFRLGPNNNLFATSTLFNRAEPGIFIGVLDYGQLSELERLRFQIKFEGTPKNPKYPALSKISLPVRDFEALKVNTAFLLKIADDMSRVIQRDSQDSPSYNICEI